MAVHECRQSGPPEPREDAASREAIADLAPGWNGYTLSRPQMAPNLSKPRNYRSHKCIARRGLRRSETGGEGGIRTHGTGKPVQRLSRPPPSTTRPPLRRVDVRRSIELATADSTRPTQPIPGPRMTIRIQIDSFMRQRIPSRMGSLLVAASPDLTAITLRPAPLRPCRKEDPEFLPPRRRAAVNDPVGL